MIGDMSKKVKIALVVALVIRLLLGAFSYHSDVVPYYFAGRVLKETPASNFYDFLPDLPEEHPYLAVYPRNLFNYPPAVYFGLGGLSALTSSMFSNDFLDQFLFALPQTLGTSSLFWLLVTLKLPFFFFDFLIFLLLRKMFSDSKKKDLVSYLWLFNPINLYATYMVGQFDIIPTFFVVWVVYLLGQKSKSNYTFEALLLGLGASFKIFPLLLLVPLASLAKNWVTKIWIVAIGVGTYVLTLLPFTFSKGFRSTALVASQTTKSLYATIAISGGESLILYIVLLIFLYILFISKPLKQNQTWRYFLLVLLTFFVFTHFHPQWFLWVTPLLILELAESKRINYLPPLFFLVTFLGMLFFFDPGLTTGLFSPLFPALYGRSGPLELMGLNLDYNFSRSVLQSIFAGVAFYYFYNLGKKNLN